LRAGKSEGSRLRKNSSFPASNDACISAITFSAFSQPDFFHVRMKILPTHREVVDGSRMLTAATGIRAADQSADEKGEEKGDSHQIWVTLIANEAWPRLEAAPGAEDPVPRRA
jgi:hypothetical protein